MATNKIVEQYLDPISMEKQEHLSQQRLAKLFATQITNFNLIDRPKTNFIDLMNWAMDNFSQFLVDKEKLNKFVHNRIVIDGQFMQFCEENKISIKCLYKDSFVSWKTDGNFEKFFAQGMFLIKSNDVEFLQGSLFAKGNQFEDEISFFIICSDTNYSEYLKLRNSFDAWITERDRSNLHIRVIGGDDVAYTKDHTWEDLFLQEDIKQEIKELVENFLSSKDFYIKNKIAYKRGMILYGPAGNGKTSLIRTIISMYDFKPVTIAADADDGDLQEAFRYCEEQHPALLYFEDLDSLLEKINVSSLLNLLDGVSSKNGLLVIATANEIKKLKANITDRPSRFDRKFEIVLPNLEMTIKYLKKWFSNLITAKKCSELAKFLVQHQCSYSHVKEFYVSCMFSALSNNRKTPIEKDIKKSLAQLVKDKNLLNNNSMSMDKYFGKT